MYQAIVFLPLLGFLIVGLFGTSLGAKASEYITCGFMVIAALLSWVAFYQVALERGGRSLHRAGYALDPIRRAGCRLGAAHRLADGGDAGGRQHGVVPRAHLLDRLHASRPASAALLRLSVAVHLRHADAGDVRQSGADVLRLGGRRPRLLPADRLLVSQAVRQRGGDQGIRRQPRRRFWFRARHFRRVRAVRLGQFRHHLRQCRDLSAGGCRCCGAWRSRGCAGCRSSRPRCCTGCGSRWPCGRGSGARGRDGAHLPRLPPRQGLGDHGRLPAALHGRDGQVGAGAAAHLAAGRDGRPDAGVGADPCRDHGHRRRVHAGAAVAAVRAGADGADGGHRHRRDHRLLRRDCRPGAERHQAGHRLFDLFAARLHVRGASASASIPPRSSTSSRTPSSRRCCSSARARSSTPCPTSRTCARWAASARSFREHTG